MLKTLEAIVALFLTFFILIVFLPPAPVNEAASPRGFLGPLAEDEGFRSCIIARNITCINSTINSNLEDNFQFIFNVSDSAYAITGLPNKEVFSESTFLAGNSTNSSQAVLRVFYWNK